MLFKPLIRLSSPFLLDAIKSALLCSIIASVKFRVICCKCLTLFLTFRRDLSFFPSRARNQITLSKLYYFMVTTGYYQRSEYFVSFGKGLILFCSFFDICFRRTFWFCKAIDQLDGTDRVLLLTIKNRKTKNG